jgi:exodeoxyribonuclease-3
LAKESVDTLKRVITNIVKDQKRTKVRDDKFPIEQINNIGYKHLLYTGDGGQCGVAILSKIKIDSIENINIINAGKRHIHFKLNNVNIHNFYIPAGGDEPDVNINPKFKQKLEYLDYIINLFSSIKSNTIILGDFNTYNKTEYTAKQLNDLEISKSKFNK